MILDFSRSLAYYKISGLSRVANPSECLVGEVDLGDFAGVESYAMTDDVAASSYFTQYDL